MNRKWTLETVREEFAKRNLTLLSTQYVNTKQSLDYIAECGHEHTISLDNFKANKGDLCKKCRYDLVGDSRRLTYKEVESLFIQNGCKLLAKSYKNSVTKLEYTAQCGHKSKVSYIKFQSGVGRICNKCSKSIRYEYDYVREYFMNSDCLLLETEYVNCKTPMRFIAQCGHEHEMNFDTFKNCPNASRDCIQCHKRRYNDGSPVEERNMYQMKLWRKTVFERDNYNCAKCSKHGGVLNAHHKNGYNLDEENRLSPDNGITLCEPCHIGFHKTYGYGMNTEEQLNHWLYGNTEVKHILKGVAHRNA